MLFRNQRKIQKKVEKSIKDFAKKMQVSSAQLVEAIKKFTEAEEKGKPFPDSAIHELEEKIIKTERECDQLKVEIVEKISTVLPKAGEDYYNLLRKVDRVVNKVETAIRRLASRMEHRSKIPKEDLLPSRIPHEMSLLADKVQETTDELQDALKVLDDDFESALEACKHVERAREEARALDFQIFGRLQSDDYTAKEAFFLEKLSVSLVAVAVAAENVSNYIQIMIIKTSM